MAGMKTRMMHLLKKKCVTIFRVAFATWRDRFVKRIYEKEAIAEFQRFREIKLMRVAFGYLSAVCEQSKEIREMTKRA